MVKTSLQIVAWGILLSLVVFLPAGTVFYPGGIVFVVLFLLTGFLFAAWLAKTDPELLQKRMASPVQRGQKGWDRAFLLTFIALYVIGIAFMSRDAARAAFSAMPGWLTAGGVGLFVLYGLGCFWTFRANRFAAPVVKIQKGHELIDTGPYTFVRHPMYASALLLFLAQPLIFGSWAGFAFSAIFILAIAWRAVREEEVLRDGLPGYAEYMQRVRYRFIPGIW